MRAVVITQFGGPEVLRLTEAPEPQVQPGQVLIDVTAAGINYADTHQAENTYLVPATLPFIPGAEVVGGTSDGRRVVALVAGGGYAERAVAYEAHTFEVPEGVSDGQALALVLQGTTAWHLLRTSAHLASGESVVVHAAAGGVGSLAVQLAKAWGAGNVIGLASSDEKRETALDLGADVAIDANSEDLKSALQAANGGRKVDVVLEMVGGTTFDASLAALAPFGRLVAYGQASRQSPTPVDAGALMSRSRAVIGFWLAHCFGAPERLLRPQMEELFSMVAAGTLRPIVDRTYPLSEAATAHEDIRARHTQGKLLLDPRA